MNFENLHNKENTPLDVSSDKAKLSAADQETANKYLAGVWDLIVTNINPKNWGVDDYTDKGDFNTAYSAARKAGEKEFMWNGERKTTAQHGEDRAESSFNLDVKERQKIYNSVDPVGYPQQELIPSIKRYVTNKRVQDEKSNNKSIDVTRKGVVDYDAWAFYMGVPQKQNSISKSKYRPTDSRDENANYYSLRNAYPYFDETVIANASEAFEFNQKKDLLGRKTSEPERKNSNTVTGAYSEFMPLENVTFSKGKDERGNYYSIYDKYDFSVPFEGKIGKPYEVYDRTYYKDYGDGKEKPMYYSDKELSELDVNKKNFDTLALQKELSNRGYKFSKSIKKDGSFDGIYGDETKESLVDRQKKN